MPVDLFEIIDEQQFLIDETSDNNSDTDSEGGDENLDNLNNDQLAENLEMESHEFIRLVSTLIRSNYSGDPQSLQSFINSIELAREVQGQHGQLLKRLLKAKH